MLNALGASKWDFKTAAHLLNRAGFGGPPADIEKIQKLGPGGAVDSLVDYERVPDETETPEWAKPDPERVAEVKELRELRLKARSGTQEQRQEVGAKIRELQRTLQRKERGHVVDLRGWWLQRMAFGPRPLQEKLTLFWHGHFATSVQKVKDHY